MATITSHYAKAALLGAKRHGVDTSQLLQYTGISQELISTANTRVHEDQLSRLIRLLWDILQDEFMGFTAHRCKPGSFAMMCELVSHCSNVEGLLKRGIEFYQLLTDDIHMALEYRDTEVELCVTMQHPALDPEHFYLEFWLVIWHRFASWISGCQLPLKRAHFHYSPPAHLDEFQFLFPCEHAFNQPQTSLVFAHCALQKPLIRTTREIAHFLKNAPSDLLTMPGEDTSIGLQVKRLVLQAVNNRLDCPTLHDIAQSMHLSPQTLRRKLHTEGNSYQRIKDAVRRDVAIEKLHAQNLPINDVATLLGFSEPRSFSRAFKQWTGVSPSSYRAPSQGLPRRS